MTYDISHITENYPPMTASEESKMIEENIGNRKRMNELLVLHNVSLVLKVVNCEIRGFEAYRDDLISAGMETLHKVAEKFDPAMHIKFSTYAYIGIKRNILLFIAQNLGKYRTHANYYLDQKINFRDDGKGDMTVESLVHDLIDPCWNTTQRTDKIIEKNDIENFGKIIVSEIKNMKGMTTRDKKIFLDYMCANKKTSFRLVGKKYGVSGERVHQIISRNIPRIQRMIKKKFGVENSKQIWGK